MFRLAASLMAACALHAAVLAGTGCWSGGSGLAQGEHPHKLASAKLNIPAGGWQWRLVPQREAARPAVPSAALSEQPAMADASASSPEAPDQAQASATPASSQDAYLPRSMLSKAPRAIGMIDIPFPPGVPTPGRYKAVLALYIDEQGVVRRVKTLDEALPAAFEEAARVSFQTASFTPGELKGQAVKSLIHIEVVFDDTRPERGLSSSALGQAVAQR